MKRIIYTRPDGQVVVLHPVINTFPNRETLSESEAVARALKDVPQDAINPTVVDASVIPSTRDKRSAWRQSGSSIVIDAVIAAKIDAVRVRNGSDVSECSECKSDQTLLGLVNQTRPEWRTWAQSNFPSLTLAEQNRIGSLCWMLAIAIRRELRA